MPDTIVASNPITIEDVEYQPGMLARLYRPTGTGPFPAALQVAVPGPARTAPTTTSWPRRWLKAASSSPRSIFACRQWQYSKRNYIFIKALLPSICILWHHRCVALFNCRSYMQQSEV